MIALMSCRTQVNATRMRVPDLILVPPVRPLDGIVERPPSLCVEILSPPDRYIETPQRVDDYLQSGVRYVWVIDPAIVLATVYTQDGAHEVRDGILTTHNPDITINLHELDPD